MTLLACPECDHEISDQALACPHCGKPMRMGDLLGYEYRSEAQLFGLPLVHIATGLDPFTGRRRVARGIIAIGDMAVGGFALGGCAVGVIALGGVGVGLFSLAGLAVGVLLAVGGLALGGIALGGLAIGGIALGGGAFGYYALGGGAFGAHPLGGNVQDPQAVEFFRQWLGNQINHFLHRP